MYFMSSFSLFVYLFSSNDNTNMYYDLISHFLVPQGATTAQIRKQYRELSKLHHPDKGGDPEVFTKIAKAYEA